MAGRGYLHPLYARSLSAFGRPRELAGSGGWILEREIPDTDLRDAMTCYPLLVCRDWSALCGDIDVLGSDLVSLTVVTDPFADREAPGLRPCFDLLEPFKEHFIVDLTKPARERTSRHHRFYARQAATGGVTVEHCPDPLLFLDDWTSLYDLLAERHGITGLQRFSREAFERQLSVPGTTLFRAVQAGVTVAAHIWYVEDERAYSHLQATSARGYEIHAAYAIYAQGLDMLASHCTVANLGAGVGRSPRTVDDGLSRFKRGWATDRRRAYLCMRVFDPAAYAELTRLMAPSGTDYIPAYRDGELV